MSGLLLLRRPLRIRCLSYRPPPQVRQYALIGKPKAKGEPTWTLPSTPARTRFAPSPTGYLHLGSLRTALFNYLLARATGGQFIIRLEDTDQTRFVRDAEARLYEDLTWAGLHWDEGPDKGGDVGPYKQSQRLALYRQHADQLLESGRAFRCFCSKEDLEFNVKQATASGATSHYPGTCTSIARAESERRAANGEPHTVRFVSSGTPVTAPDLVYGAYRKAEREDNFIIMKSDGWPTYHFANVVDDHYMNITHVVRGAEWLISTPMHVELYDAFGWQPPNFAHVGLLVDQQRQKLSKRDIDNIGVSVYRNNKIMPEALLNFSVLLGWDPNLQNNPRLDKRGIMTLKEMTDNFTLKFTRGDIVVNLAKLKHFQASLTRNLISGQVVDPDALRKHVIKPIMEELEKINDNWEKYSVSADSVDDEYRKLFDAIGERRLFVSEDHVLQVLKAWKGPVDDLIQFVHDNIFAFYPISRTALSTTFLELQENVRKIVIDKEYKKVLNADLHKVMAWFRKSLDEIKEGEWNEENLKSVAKMLADSIQYYDEKKKEPMVNSPGWRFLRWALFNGKSGLSIVPMMVLLGRQETLNRLRVARKVARHEEELLQMSRRRTELDADSKKVRIQFLGDPTTGRNAERNAVRMTIEPRNVKVLVPEAERRPNPDVHISREDRDYRSPQLRDEPMGSLVTRGPAPAPVHQGQEQDQGPFVTRGPSPGPTKSPRRDPRDVGRAPEFLEFQAWKEGERHLDLGKGQGQEKEKEKGRKDYAPAFWELQAKAEETALQGKSQSPAESPAGDHWASPRRSSGRDLYPQRDPDLGKEEEEDERDDYAPALWELQAKAEDTRPKEGSPAGNDWASPRRSSDRDPFSKRTSTLPPQAPVPKPAPPPETYGPFRLDPSVEAYKDYHGHVQHLRALNIAARRGRAARVRAITRERMQQGPVLHLDPAPGRVDARKEADQKAPLYAGSGKPLGRTPREIEAQRSGEKKGLVWSGETATPGEAFYESRKEKWAEGLEIDVPSPEDVTRSVVKHARGSELERMVIKAIRSRDDVSMDELERRLVQEWTKRNS